MNQLSRSAIVCIGITISNCRVCAVSLSFPLLFLFLLFSSPAHRLALLFLFVFVLCRCSALLCSALRCSQFGWSALLCSAVLSSAVLDGASARSRHSCSQSAQPLTLFIAYFFLSNCTVAPRGCCCVYERIVRIS